MEIPTIDDIWRIPRPSLYSSETTSRYSNSSISSPSYNTYNSSATEQSQGSREPILKQKYLKPPSKHINKKHHTRSIEDECQKYSNPTLGIVMPNHEHCEVIVQDEKSRTNLDLVDNWINSFDRVSSSSSNESCTSNSNSSTSDSTSHILLGLSTTNLVQIKNDPLTTKAFDSLSTTSSSRFTIVNGASKRIKKNCCRSHQITVLCLTMSFLFLIGIVVVVVYLELKAREIHYM